MKLSCRELLIVVVSLCGIGFFGALMLVDQVGFFHVLGEVHDVIFEAIYGVFTALKIVFFSALAVGACAVVVVGYREWGVVRPGKYGPAQAIKRFGKDPYELRQPMTIDEEKLRKQMILTIREIARAQGAMEKVIDANPTQKQIEAPRIRPMSLAQQLEQRLTRVGEAESILGYDAEGPRRGPWDKLHSFFVVGGSGSGKSSTVAYYAALGILHGARLLLIDPDSEFEESITHRLAALEPFFLCPAGIDPRSAKHVIEVAEQESKKPGPYPVIFIVDEFSTIMRHGKTGGEWKEIADPLAAVLEEYGQRGRKRGRTSIIIGQIAKATRTGGTELRESMTATFVHRLKPQQAGLVLDADEAKQCQYLEPGEAMILLSNAVETYRMRIPYADQQAMSMVAQLMEPTFYEEPTVSLHTTGDLAEPGSNFIQTSHEHPHELAWDAKVRKVDELRQANRTQQQIIYQVWGANKGSSVSYVQARKEYQQIIVWLNSMEGGD